MPIRGSEFQAKTELGFGGRAVVFIPESMGMGPVVQGVTHSQLVLDCLR